jgi:FkbM family methyltransferase
MASTPPRLFRLVKLLTRTVPRTDWLLAPCCRFWSNETITYELSPSVSLAVPIGRRENCWDLRDIRDYESDLIEEFCSALAPFSRVTLVDCGADIGLFSAIACSRCACISRVVAFEPNPRINELFRRNITSLPHGEPRSLAVSSFEGFGRLERPEYDNSDHARYLAPAAIGIPVTKVDSLRIFEGDVAIKIDVEGGEMEVLRGAAETIRRSPHCVLTLEAHPKVCSRTGLSPCDCMEFLESIRPFHFTVTETHQRVRARDFVVDPTRVLNILAVSAEN